MRVIAGILFVLGIPPAVVAWILIFGGPAAAIEELRAGRTWSAIVLLLTWPLIAAHVGLGYYIWVRWFTITRGQSKSTRRFWLVASGHHAAWIVLMGVSHLQGDPAPPSLFKYAAVVFCTCVASTVVTRRDPPATPASG